MTTQSCGICKRILNNDKDPLSFDVGGDCLGCMIFEELSVGDYKTCSNLGKELVIRIRNLQSLGHC